VTIDDRDVARWYQAQRLPNESVRRLLSARRPRRSRWGWGALAVAATAACAAAALLLLARPEPEPEARGVARPPPSSGPPEIRAESASRWLVEATALPDDQLPPEDRLWATRAHPRSSFELRADPVTTELTRTLWAGAVRLEMDDVRIEAFVNTQSYDYGEPGVAGVAGRFEVVPSPWTLGLHVVKVGLVAPGGRVDVDWDPGVVEGWRPVWHGPAFAGDEGQATALYEVLLRDRGRPLALVTASAAPDRALPIPPATGEPASVDTTRALFAATVARVMGRYASDPRTRLERERMLELGSGLPTDADRRLYSFAVGIEKCRHFQIVNGAHSSAFLVDENGFPCGSAKPLPPAPGG
jgi:hypothetical protein